MKLDFGSGYSPSKGWATLDFGYRCTFQDIADIKDKSIRKIRFRNVLHHIEDIESLFSALEPKFRDRVKITIIECRKEFYKTNVFLDKLWYRGIIPNTMFISDEYRDYVTILENKGYVVCYKRKQQEKEIITLTRR